MNDKEFRIFQWLKTDKAGEYSYEDEIIEEDGISYLTFTDGSRINTELIGDYIIEVKDEEDGYIIKEEIINDIVESIGKDGIVYEVPGPNHGKVKRVKQRIPKKSPKKTRVTKPTKEPKSANDPVKDLLDKAKKETHIYDIQLYIKSIPESLYDVIVESFEDGEEHVLDYIIEQLDMDRLKEQLRIAIKERKFKKTPQIKQ